MSKKKPKTDWSKAIKWKKGEGMVDVKRIFPPPEIKFLDYNSDKK